MSGHEWEIAILAIGALLTAVIGSIFRRAEKTGERIGRMEQWIDHERGRQAGYADGFERGWRAANEQNRGSDVK